MQRRSRWCRVTGVVKDYDWGGDTYLADLLRLPPTGRPMAEYWIGTHPDGHSIEEQTSLPIESLLGRPMCFLAKVLDVRQMLSIQIHPDIHAAREGFAREEAAGIDRKAPFRNYRDDRHKPELMIALSEFWLLHGFADDDTVESRLACEPQFGHLLEVFRSNGLTGLYTYIMQLPQDRVNETLRPVGKRLKPLYERGALDKQELDYWIAKAFIQFGRPGQCDRGIFSMYLMQLLHLQPGEAVFQAPGILHAYLEGQNFECMAASDNVVRGGLTNKHIDVKELLKLVRCQHEPVGRIIPEGMDGLRRYTTSAKEFMTYRLLSGAAIELDGLSLIINVGRRLAISIDGAEVQLEKGHVLLLEGGPTVVVSEGSAQDFLLLVQEGR